MAQGIQRDMEEHFEIEWILLFYTAKRNASAKFIHIDLQQKRSQHKYDEAFNNSLSRMRIVELFCEVSRGQYN